MIENLDQIHQVLAEKGVDLCGHFLMCTAGYRIALPPQAFISSTKGLSDGDPRGEFSLDEFAAALERLLLRRWMLVLEQLDVERELDRRRQSLVPEVGNPGYKAGDVDLSPVGYAAHRDIVRALFGDDFLAESDTGFNLDETARRFDVYSPDSTLCAEVMNRIEGDGGSYTGTPSPRFIGRAGPSAIGQWMPDQFLLLSAGFHGILYYEP